eukprot:gene4055-14141_t
MQEGAIQTDPNRKKAATRAELLRDLEDLRSQLSLSQAAREKLVQVLGPLKEKADLAFQNLQSFQNDKAATEQLYQKERRARIKLQQALKQQRLSKAELQQLQAQVAALLRRQDMAETRTSRLDSMVVKQQSEHRSLFRGAFGTLALIASGVSGVSTALPASPTRQKLLLTMTGDDPTATEAASLRPSLLPGGGQPSQHQLGGLSSGWGSAARGAAPPDGRAQGHESQAGPSRKRGRDVRGDGGRAQGSQEDEREEGRTVEAFNDVEEVPMDNCWEDDTDAVVDAVVGDNTGGRDAELLLLPYPFLPDAHQPARLYRSSPGTEARDAAIAVEAVCVHGTKALARDAAIAVDADRVHRTQALASDAGIAADADRVHGTLVLARDAANAVDADRVHGTKALARDAAIAVDADPVHGTEALARDAAIAVDATCLPALLETVGNTSEAPEGVFSGGSATLRGETLTPEVLPSESLHHHQRHHQHAQHHYQHHDQRHQQDQQQCLQQQLEESAHPRKRREVEDTRDDGGPASMGSVLARVRTPPPVDQPGDKVPTSPSVRQGAAPNRGSFEPGPPPGPIPRWLENLLKGHGPGKAGRGGTRPSLVLPPLLQDLPGDQGGPKRGRSVKLIPVSEVLAPLCSTEGAVPTGRTVTAVAKKLCEGLNRGRFPAHSIASAVESSILSTAGLHVELCPPLNPSSGYDTSPEVSKHNTNASGGLDHGRAWLGWAQASCRQRNTLQHLVSAILQADSFLLTSGAGAGPDPRVQPGKATGPSQSVGAAPKGPLVQMLLPLMHHKVCFQTQTESTEVGPLIDGGGADHAFPMQPVSMGPLATERCALASSHAQLCRSTNNMQAWRSLVKDLLQLSFVSYNSRTPIQPPTVESPHSSPPAVPKPSHTPSLDLVLPLYAALTVWPEALDALPAVSTHSKGGKTGSQGQGPRGQAPLGQAPPGQGPPGVLLGLTPVFDCVAVVGEACPAEAGGASGSGEELLSTPKGVSGSVEKLPSTPLGVDPVCADPMSHVLRWALSVLGRELTGEERSVLGREMSEGERGGLGREMTEEARGGLGRALSVQAGGGGGSATELEELMLHASEVVAQPSHRVEAPVLLHVSSREQLGHAGIPSPWGATPSLYMGGSSCVVDSSGRRRRHSSLTTPEASVASMSRQATNAGHGQATMQGHDKLPSAGHDKATNRRSRQATIAGHDKATIAGHDKPTIAGHDKLPQSQVTTKLPSQGHDKLPSQVHEQATIAGHDKLPSQGHDKLPRQVPTSYHHILFAAGTKLSSFLVSLGTVSNSDGASKHSSCTALTAQGSTQGSTNSFGELAASLMGTLHWMLFGHVDELGVAPLSVTGGGARQHYRQLVGAISLSCQFAGLEASYDCFLRPAMSWLATNAQPRQHAAIVQLISEVALSCSVASLSTPTQPTPGSGPSPASLCMQIICERLLAMLLSSPVSASSHEAPDTSQVRLQHYVAAAVVTVGTAFCPPSGDTPLGKDPPGHLLTVEDGCDGRDDGKPSACAVAAEEEGSAIEGWPLGKPNGAVMVVMVVTPTPKPSTKGAGLDLWSSGGGDSSDYRDLFDKHAPLGQAPNGGGSYQVDSRGWVPVDRPPWDKPPTREIVTKWTARAGSLWPGPPGTSPQRGRFHLRAVQGLGPRGQAPLGQAPLVGGSYQLGSTLEQFRGWAPVARPPWNKPPTREVVAN